MVKRARELEFVVSGSSIDSFVLSKKDSTFTVNTSPSNLGVIISDILCHKVKSFTCDEGIEISENLKALSLEVKELVLLANKIKEEATVRFYEKQ